MSVVQTLEDALRKELADKTFRGNLEHVTQACLEACLAVLTAHAGILSGLVGELGDAAIRKVIAAEEKGLVDVAGGSISITEVPNPNSDSVEAAKP